MSSFSTSTTNTPRRREETDKGHPEFEKLIARIIESVDKTKLAELRRDFHTRLRISLTQPDNPGLVEDLWDYFYDWCFFEQGLPEKVEGLSSDEVAVWNHVKVANQRGLFVVQKITDEALKLKELYGGETYLVRKRRITEPVGLSRGDIVEARILGEAGADAVKNQHFVFLRKPSYHPNEVHSYLKMKVKQFKRGNDQATYETWLWLLVGMYLKHRIYPQLPVEKIYDDNSRI